MPELTLPELVEQIQCPVCNHWYADKEDVEYILASGECLRCDHLKGDL